MTDQTPDTALTLRAIKGMDKDMSCRGHKFEVGQSYTVSGEIKACDNGFHSCPVDDDTPPHAVFEYYAPGVSRYFDVEADGKIDREGNKIASASLTIGVEISIGEVMRRVPEWCVKKASGAAFSHAYNSKVMCEGDGQVLYCTEFADDGSITSVACGITGRGKIKKGVWYHAKGGKLVEFSA